MNKTLRVTGSKSIGAETYRPGLYTVSDDNRSFGKRVSPEHAEQLIAAGLAHYEGE
jgi:hypothetical protein